ncbi:BTB POZ domain containing [Seminavis robusta]|uniref:BTB POZ domain containing n=1 Tax=Seminavis robusta TaxID=568900 RepID=A0A9N8F367_9STRA|nr:BTB POZ domain containing [Seminavis robusta]|eukprot:Sro3009_g342080.1 BTB POZ domain containing (274) ;mRNA; f:8004-8899
MSENASAINTQQQSSSCKTPDEMLAKFLTVDSLNDIILKGNDGVEVPANRFLLAARSDVFMGMLLGKFQESSSAVIELGFPGNVLKGVVEFVLTNTAQVLHVKTDAEDISPQKIRSLVSLAEAASYFDLAGLGEMVFESFEKHNKADPCASFAILQACRISGNSIPKMLVEKAKEWVQTTQTKSVSANHVAGLSTNVMEEILLDPDMLMTEFELFQILSLWVESNPSQRKEAAAGLSKCISFEKISIENLTTTVASSGNPCKAKKGTLGFPET